MIVYLSNKARFREDVLSNRIHEIVQGEFKRVVGKAVGENELRSWKNSLQAMDSVISDEGIPHDTGVAIEFNIPQTSKRVDFILTGRREDGTRSAVIVELKQWQKAEATSMDAIVSTFVGGREREVSHPSYQAWSYAMLIEDFNENVRQDPIDLNPCAYLHNCESDKVILHPHYAHHLRQAPAFLRDDAKKLQNFIKQHVKKGDNGEVMYRIRDGRIRPSKSLADHLASLLKGNKEFYLIDDQKTVYETALRLAEVSTPQNKNVLLVNGGPGTGKTVVAINLLVELTNRDLVAKYVTKNSAPRQVYQAKLQGSFTKTRIANLFVGSGSFTDTEANVFQGLIVDESHRLNEKSGMFSNMGENQIKELIAASTFTVFFLDEDQMIHWKDIGSKEQVHHWAKVLGAEVTEMNLGSQFRCNGSDGYLAWTDHALQIRETPNHTLEGSHYEFKACASARELKELIHQRNRISNKARMVAGYCWDWVSRKTKSNPQPKDHDIRLDGGEFQAKWNLSEDGMLWILKPDSVHEVGCIHTCQGLELDYVGVIIGPDLIVRDGKVITDGAKRSKGDSSIKGYKGLLKKDANAAREKAERIIKNTYRTLMTRGLKGCYLYSEDAETLAYFQQRGVGALEPEMEDQAADSGPCPFEVFSAEEAAGRTNAVPIFDLQAAAGDFSEEQWVDEARWMELPEPFAAKADYFVAQVVGESMNRRIPNGSWCLFRKCPAGSRNGKVVLVQLRDRQDSDTGGSYTVKIYSSQKEATDEGWQHQSITLRPDSTHPIYQPMELTEDAVRELVVVGELIAPLVNLNASP